MRLFPEQYRGIHPAFPAWPEGSLLERTGPLSAVKYSGVLAFFVGGVCRLLGRPSPLATATKTAAYFTVGLTAFQTTGHFMRDRAARKFLKAHDIEVPNNKFLDRLGRLDPDDVAIFGGISGLLFFKMWKAPSSVFGWKRSVGGFTLGSAYSGILFEFETFRRTPDIILKDQQRINELQEEVVKWRPIVARALTSLSLSTQPATMTPTPDSGNFNLLRSGPGANSNGSASGSQGGTMGRINISGPPQGGTVSKDDPHITIQLPDDAEPILQPQTNYEWKSDHEIENLEKYIGKLLQRRQRLARESEFLWSWLAEKEAEYYNTPDGPAKKAMVRYLDILAGGQRSTWAEVSMTDWMIADAKKRIEQRRSAASNNESKVTWRAPCSQAAAHTAPTHALKGARNLLQGIDQLNTQFLQMQTQMAIEMADPDFELKENNQVYHPGKQKMVSEKEAFLDSKKAIQEQIDEIASIQNAIKDMLADGEAKVEQIPQDTKSPKQV